MLEVKKDWDYTYRRRLRQTESCSANPLYFTLWTGGHYSRFEYGIEDKNPTLMGIKAR
jgi:hypothetical protein